MSHPNIFEINAQQQGITLNQLKKAFPMPGSYHFRFLTTIPSGNKNISVWMDTTDENSTVPVNSTGQIFAKLSRVSSSSKLVEICIVYISHITLISFLKTTTIINLEFT